MPAPGNTQAATLYKAMLQRVSNISAWHHHHAMSVHRVAATTVVAKKRRIKRRGDSGRGGDAFSFSFFLFPSHQSFFNLINCGVLSFLLLLIIIIIITFHLLLSLESWEENCALPLLVKVALSSKMPFKLLKLSFFNVLSCHCQYTSNALLCKPWCHYLCNLPPPQIIFVFIDRQTDSARLLLLLWLRTETQTQS